MAFGIGNAEILHGWAFGQFFGVQFCEMDLRRLGFMPQTGREVADARQTDHQREKRESCPA